MGFERNIVVKDRDVIRGAGWTMEAIHTPGHTSHVVASGNSKVLVQGDVTAGAATLFVRNPNWQPLFDTDKPQAVETRKKLYDMAASEKMIVQGFHFPFPAVAYVEKSGSGYRLVAVPWSSSI